MNKKYGISIEIESDETMSDEDKEMLIENIASKVNEFLGSNYPNMVAIVSVEEKTLVEKDGE